MIREDREQGVADEGKVAQGVGLAGARAVFTPKGVATPVVADFDAAPVTADQILPLGRGTVGGFGAGEVEAVFDGGLAAAFDGAFAADDDQGANEREIDGVRFAGEGVELARDDPPVARVGLGKKGGPSAALAVSA